MHVATTRDKNEPLGRFRCPHGGGEAVHVGGSGGKEGVPGGGVDVDGAHPPKPCQPGRDERLLCESTCSSASRRDIFFGGGEHFLVCFREGDGRTSRASTSRSGSRRYLVHRVAYCRSASEGE